MTVHQLHKAVDPHLAQVVQQAKKDYEETFELARQMCSFLIEEAASAQRENRKLRQRIEELEQELDLADTAVDYYQRRDW